MKFVSIAGITSLLAVVSVSAFAQTTQTAFLQFTFRDSARGNVIKPDAVLVNNKVMFNTIDEAGRMTIPVPAGEHNILIKKKGYDDLVTRQTAQPDHTPNNLVMLDPAEQPQQLRPENLSQDMPADGTVIAGFVVDQTTGKPVSAADVELIGKDKKVTTDADGFFKLPVPLPDGQQMPDDPRGVRFGQRNFRVTKAGYGFEERLNVLVESGAPKIFQIELIRGGGGNSLDEAAGRNNLQSGLFGITNVEPEDEPTTGIILQPRRELPPELHHPPTDDNHNHNGHNHSHDGHNH